MADEDTEKLTPQDLAGVMVVYCPGCGKKYRIRGRPPGGTIPCTQCQRSFPVEDAEGEPAKTTGVPAVPAPKTASRARPAGTPPASKTPGRAMAPGGQPHRTAPAPLAPGGAPLAARPARPATPPVPPARPAGGASPSDPAFRPPARPAALPVPPGRPAVAVPPAVPVPPAVFAQRKETLYEHLPPPAAPVTPGRQVTQGRPVIPQPSTLPRARVPAPAGGPAPLSSPVPPSIPTQPARGAPVEPSRPTLPAPQPVPPKAPIRMLREDQLAGVELNGFLCEQPVGRGGMGVVYRAKDLKLGRTVAIKVLARAFSSDEKQVGRFKREGKAAARLNHPNVATIHNIDDLEGLHFIIMEFLEGRNLEAVVESDGPLDPREAARFVARAAEALHAAHQAKVVHRDIKPANLFLTNAGEIKITDFGLARDYGVDDGLTRTGQIVGTPHFMSPEQGEGKQVDARSDIYSLGCSFYFLLTGKKPFEGDSPIAVMVAHIREQPVPPHEINPKVPPAMSQVILKMMAKTPEERQPTMAEVARVVGRMAESDAAEPEPVAAPERAPEPVRQEARQEPATGTRPGGGRTGRNKGLEGSERREGRRSPTRKMGESGPRPGVDRPRTTGPRSGAGGEPSSYQKRRGSREAGPKRMNPLVPIAIVVAFVALALVVVLLLMK